MLKRCQNTIKNYKAFFAAYEFKLYCPFVLTRVSSKKSLPLSTIPEMWRGGPSRLSTLSDTSSKRLPSDKKISFQLIRILATLIILLIGVVSLTTVLFVSSNKTYESARIIQTHVDTNIRIGRLAEALQRERGMSAMFLSSHNKNKNDLDKLESLRNATDIILPSLESPHWREFSIGNQTFTSNKNLYSHILNIRRLVKNLVINSDEAIKSYTNIIVNLIKGSQSQQSKISNGQLQMMLTSSYALLQATEELGKQRALGSIFYQVCILDSSQKQWFTELTAIAETYKNVAIQLDTLILKDFENLTKGIQEEVESYNSIKNCIRDTECINSCSNQSIKLRNLNSHWWFFNMTNYIDVIFATKQLCEDRIGSVLNKLIESSRLNMVLYLSIMMIALVACFVIIIHQTFIIRGMIKNVKVYTFKITRRSRQLSLEQERSDNLLYQMLPRQIAAQLKRSRSVEPEFYECVTIYFSDVVDFTSFSSRVTPWDVVAMLNSMYNLFDSCIEKYNVYKVETIGDAYMVASGLEEHKNSKTNDSCTHTSNNHAVEVAQVALNLTQAMETFHVTEVPNEKFQIRVGIHSGSCVAGIVGTKMPRYSLFGDNVNIASRMESSGEAQKIHVSEVTYTLLKDSNDFDFTARGEIEIKGKGTMKTYWLQQGPPMNTPREIT